MFNKDLKDSALKLYNNLKILYKINGKDRIKLIENTFNCDITSLYKWKKEKNIHHLNTYKNTNISQKIVDDIIYIFKKLKFSSIDKIKKYINNINKSSLNNKTIAYILKVNNLECENFKIKKEIEKFIIDSVIENKVITIKEIIKNIYLKYNISLSKSSIYKILKINKFSYKQVKIKTNPNSYEEEKEKIVSVGYVINELEIKNICSYDEISAVTNEKPKRGWSKKGEECIIENKNTLYGERFTIGLTVDTEKVVNFKIVKGGMKTDDFVDLMKDFQNNYNKNMDKTVFLDNASVHHSKKFKEFTRETKIHVLYNVPYNSDKNPVEYVFSLLRKVLERSTFKTIEDLTSIVNNFKNNLSSIKLNNIFNHAFNLFNI